MGIVQWLFATLYNEASLGVWWIASCALITMDADVLTAQGTWRDASMELT